MDSENTPSDILARDAVLQPGEEFGDYQIDVCLTNGLLGRIYQGMHVETERPYSICVLPYRANTDARLGGRLRRYAQQASELHHPNLVNIYEWKIIRGRFCLIMDPITGRALSQIRREKIEELAEGFETIDWQNTEAYESAEVNIPSTVGFGTKWVKEVTTNLAETLGYLQEKRLAHGAIAPAYIFVDSVGRVQSALGGLLTVLGKPLFEVIVSSEIAPVDSASLERQITVIDALSPEVQAGDPPSIKSDLYALGIITYWLFTGRLFSALPTHLPLMALRSDLSQDWSEIVDDLLEANPEKRLGSPASLLFLLNEVQANAAPVKSEDSKASNKNSQGTTGKKKPNIVLVSILSVVVCLILIGGVGYGLMAFLGSEKTIEEASVAATAPPPLPPWIDLEFKSIPGAQILAIGKEGVETTIGVIPEVGYLSVSEVLRLGTYKFQATHPDYEAAVIEEYTLERDGMNLIELKLIPLPSNAEIWSIPDGVTITVQNEVRGQTPLKLEDLPANEPLVIEASLDGHRSKVQEIVLEPNSNMVIDFGEFEYQEALIEPRITLEGEEDPSAIESIELVINGVTVSLNEGQISVAPGLMRFTVSHPDYQELTQSFEINDAQVLEIAVALKPKPGIIQILGQLPEQAQIFVDQREISFPKTGEILLGVTPRQEHIIQIKALDYFPVSQAVTVDANRKVSLRPKMTRLPGPSAEQPWVVPYVNLRMLPIPAGEATMGSPLPEHARLPNEGPIVRQMIDTPFWIGAYEVTQSEYQFITGQNPSEFKGPEYPVDSVTWNDAMEYCKLLTQRERIAGRLPNGYMYRLPTELEWEYAARAGTDTPFVWGGYAHNGLGNFTGVYPRGSTFEDAQTEHYGSIKVGSYKPNEWGLYDVHGNVREWTLDAYLSRPPRSLDMGRDQPRNALRRTQRGGSWADRALACRSASRLAVSPSVISSAVGFRVVLAPELSELE